MSTTDEPLERPPISVWRRLLVATGVLVLVLVAAGVARWGYERTRAVARLRALIAELDEQDEPWKLDDIEAAREEVPEGQNSARAVMAAVRLMPKNWPDYKFDQQFEGVGTPELLDEGRLRLLDEELNKVTPAVELARRIADMPRGRHKLVIAPNPIATLLPDVQETRRVSSLLNNDAWRLALKGDVKAAIRSSRAGVNAGRSIGEEPFLISQLVRIACVSVGLSAAERALALGEAPDAELAELARLLEVEEKHPTLLVAMRGERGMQQKLWDGLASGAISTKGLFDGLGGPVNGDWRDHLFGPSRSEFRRQWPQMLELMNRMVEVAGRPPHEQAAAMKAVETRIQQLPRSARLVRLLVPAVAKTAQAFRRKVASVSALRVLVAVERYRMKEGKWPEKLEDLPPALLGRVPIDPYDGKPIRYRRLADGVVVYSVGEDGADNGGTIDRQRTMGPGIDIGYRLWDVKQRRQPPRPRPPMPEDGPGAPGGPPGGPGGAPPPR